jgi:hypothetical protein
LKTWIEPLASRCHHERQIAKLKERNALAAAGLPGIAKQETDAAKRLASLQSEINALQAGEGINGAPPLEGAARLGLVQALVKEYGELYGRVQAVTEEQDKLAAAGQASKLSQWMAKFATDAEKAETEIAKAKKELGSAFTPELEQHIRQKYTPDKSGKLQGKNLEAQEYYAGLVAENKAALDKINAEEQKALLDNSKRMAEDKANAAVYAQGKVEIHKKFARERATLEEKTTQEVAQLNISITTDELTKIEAVRAEEFRRADAMENLGTMTHGEAERAKTLATFTAARQRAALQEQLAQTQADTSIAAATDELTKIDLIRQEAYRRADAAAKAGAITAAQAEADKAKAAIDAQNSIRTQVMSVNPVAQLQKEYQDKLAIVQFYEQQMAQAGIDGATFVEQKRAELSNQYRLQRQALAESEFAAQSDGNKVLMDSLNSLGSTATSTISGLVTGTMTATDAMRNLAGVVLNEAVGALVQIGMQYLKNAIISQSTSSAMAAAQTAAIATTTTAQVASTTTMAATSTAAAGTVAAAAAPAAGLMSIATLGEAALIGGAAIIGTMAIAKSFGGNRQYGGSVTAGSLYRVNESGQPEMFTGSNGQQYMMPTASGNVTPANQVGNSQAPTVIIQNMGTPQQVQSQSYDEKTNTLTLVVAEISNQISSNSGPVWSALRGSTNVKGRL